MSISEILKLGNSVADAYLIDVGNNASTKYLGYDTNFSTSADNLK